MTTRPRVYLAGPDVFRPDAALHFALLAAVCDTLGLEALSPFDETFEANTSALDIYAKNMAMLRSAQGVVANLAAFRGAEPDSGTVFEVGVAAALGPASGGLWRRRRGAEPGHGRTVRGEC